MRIIAGKHRGRTLALFRGTDVRPTADRVKESLFQILSSRLYGARVLDLFSGSGALGLESLSRGAAQAEFCDSSAESVALLRKNLAALKETGKIYECDFRVCLARTQGKYDLIFADPPYKEEYLTEILIVVGERGLLSEEGLVVYESEREEEGAEGWEKADERVYGRTRVSMWRKI